MVKIRRLLEIEKKLNITITMPQICHFCGEEITKKYGMDSKTFGMDPDSLCFHSLDGNHGNWDPSNKVPGHRRCHIKYHSGKASLKEKYSKKFQNIGGCKGFIVPRAWINSVQEKYPDKVLIGVYLDTNNEKIHVTPMWEDEE